MKVAVAGLVAGALLQIALSYESAGMLFVLIPPLVLYVVGFSMGIKPALIAACSAVAGIIAVGGTAAGIVNFVVFYAVPALYFIQRSLMWRAVDNTGTKEWYPLGNILLVLTLYFSAIFLFMGVVSENEAGWLHKTIEQDFPKELERVDPEQAKLLKDAKVDTGTLVYIVLGVATWLSVLVFYGLAVAAHQLLKLEKKQQRPSMRLEQFRIPTWLLMLLGGCAVVLVAGDGTADAGKVLLISLLLPYFLSGMCLIHDKVTQSQWRMAILAGIYMLLVLMVWPVALIILVGLAHQCNLLKPMPVYKK